MESKPNNKIELESVEGLSMKELREIKALTVQDYSYLETLTGFIGDHRMNFGKSELRLTRDRNGLILNSEGSTLMLNFITSAEYENSVAIRAVEHVNTGIRLKLNIPFPISRSLEIDRGAFICKIKKVIKVIKRMNKLEKGMTKEQTEKPTISKENAELASSLGVWKARCNREKIRKNT